MSFKSETYRVLIASLSDLAEERQAATEAVNDWNALRAWSSTVWSRSQRLKTLLLCPATVLKR
jgi:hypothetical protein